MNQANISLLAEDRRRMFLTPVGLYKLVHLVVYLVHDPYDPLGLFSTPIRPLLGYLPPYNWQCAPSPMCLQSVIMESKMTLEVPERSLHGF